jgi:hypothetical protein
LKYKPEKAENLDLEVLTYALSFEIKNIGVKNFESMALFRAGQLNSKNGQLNSIQFNSCT